MRGDRSFRFAVEWIQGRLRHLIVEPMQARDRLFVSRTDAAHRFLVNEDELFSALSLQGFRHVVPGRMTVREQIETFSRARMIVAPHGASLTNIIFSQPGLRLIEISSSNILHMADFRWIAQMMKHHVTSIVSYDYVMNEEQKRKIGEVNWDYRVSVRDVIKAVLDHS
jgi:capsular polysaccharide biosynthesis protein